MTWQAAGRIIERLYKSGMGAKPAYELLRDTPLAISRQAMRDAFAFYKSAEVPRSVIGRVGRWQQIPGVALITESGEAGFPWRYEFDLLVRDLRTDDISVLTRSIGLDRRVPWGEALQELMLRVEDDPDRYGWRVERGTVTAVYNREILPRTERLER